MKVLCFDIGGTDIKYGIIEDEKIILKDKMPTSYQLGIESVEARIINVTKDLLKEHDIMGVGISVAGCVDYFTGRIIEGPESIPEFNNWDLPKLFMDNFGLKVIVDNDVNCFGIAEGKSGAASKFHNYLTLTIGTGIGGAIVINDEMWRGNEYKAAEFGRMQIEGGKFEAIATTSALVRSARLNGLKVADGIDVFKLYDEKNKVAKEVVTNFYHNLALGIANLIYIFNPEAIVIGGGISNRKTFAVELKREIKKIMLPGFFENVKILNAFYGNDGGLMGGYYNFCKSIGR